MSEHEDDRAAVVWVVLDESDPYSGFTYQGVFSTEQRANDWIASRPEVEREGLKAAPEMLDEPDALVPPGQGGAAEP